MWSRTMCTGAPEESDYVLAYVLEESDYVYRQNRESDYVRVGLCVRGSGCNPGSVSIIS